MPPSYDGFRPRQLGEVIDGHGVIAEVLYPQGFHHALWCEAPVLFHRGGGGMKVPCRKCAPCARYRIRELLGRSIREVIHAPRNWLVTLTWANEPTDEATAVAEVQRFWKRLAKGREEPLVRAGVIRPIPPARFRRLVVFERGSKNRRLHCHALVHGDVRWLQLNVAWHAGFMHARLIPNGLDETGRVAASAAQSCYYAVKYILKAGTKYRASLYYGSPGLNRNRKGGPTPTTVGTLPQDNRTATTTTEPVL